MPLAVSSADAWRVAAMSRLTNGMTRVLSATARPLNAVGRGQLRRVLRCCNRHDDYTAACRAMVQQFQAFAHGNDGPGLCRTGLQFRLVWRVHLLHVETYARTMAHLVQEMGLEVLHREVARAVDRTTAFLVNPANAHLHRLLSVLVTGDPPTGPTASERWKGPLPAMLEPALGLTMLHDAGPDPAGDYAQRQHLGLRLALMAVVAREAHAPVADAVPPGNGWNARGDPWTDAMACLSPEDVALFQSVLTACLDVKRAVPRASLPEPLWARIDASVLRLTAHPLLAPGPSPSAAMGALTLDGSAPPALSELLLHAAAPLVCVPLAHHHVGKPPAFVVAGAFPAPGPGLLAQIDDASPAVPEALVSLVLGATLYPLARAAEARQAALRSRVALPATAWPLTGTAGPCALAVGAGSLYGAATVLLDPARAWPLCEFAIDSRTDRYLGNLARHTLSYYRYPRVCSQLASTLDDDVGTMQDSMLQSEDPPLGLFV